MSRIGSLQHHSIPFMTVSKLPMDAKMYREMDPWIHLPSTQKLPHKVICGKKMNDMGRCYQLLCVVKERKELTYRANIVSNIYAYIKWIKLNFLFFILRWIKWIGKQNSDNFCIPLWSVHIPLWRPLHLLLNSHCNPVSQTLLSSTLQMRKLSPGRLNDLPEGHTYLEAEQDWNSEMPDSEFLTA